MNDTFTRFENIRYLGELWQHFQDNPDSVSPRWQAYFAALEKNRPVLPGISAGLAEAGLNSTRVLGLEV